MDLGTIVTFTDSSKWVLVVFLTKKISGMVREKKFLKIPEKPLTAEETRIYTKARAATATVVGKNKLSKNEFSFYKKLQYANWEIHTN